MKEHYSASATALALHASLAAGHAVDASLPQSIANLELRSGTQIISMDLGPRNRTPPVVPKS